MDWNSIPTLADKDRLLLGLESAGPKATIPLENLSAFGLEPPLRSLLQENGLRKAVTETWKSGSQAIQVDYFCLQDSKAAFSAFTFLPPSDDSGSSSTDPGIPIRSRDGIYFWQANLLVRIRAQEGKDMLPGSKRWSLASLLSRSISLKEKALLPPLMLFLPKESMTPGSTRYLLGKSGLGGVLQRVSGEGFGFQDSVEAVSADYSFGSSSGRLILLGYPNPNLARQYFDSIQEEMARSGWAKEDYQIKRNRLLIALLVGRADPEMVSRFLGKIEYTYNIKWIYDRKKAEFVPSQSVSLLGVFIQSFLLLGLAGMGAVLIGLCIGGSRYLIHDLFQNQALDQPKKWRIVRLKLVE